MADIRAFPLNRHVATERLARRLYELGREDTPEQLGDHLHHQCELAFNKMIAAGVPADVAEEQEESLFFAMTDMIDGWNAEELEEVEGAGPPPRVA